MEIVTDLKRVQKRAFGNLVLALGNFDGVHLGHLEILGLIQKRAQAFRGEAAVFTFKEHPQRILHQKEDPLILTSLIHKLTLLKQAGIRLCFLVDFTAAISEKSPEAFVREVLVDTLGIRAVCLGFNARFGHNRSGDSRLMKQLAEKYRFTFLEAPSYELEGQVVSSSLIRSLVREGKLKEAGAFLGRPYSFFGVVHPGSGRGKTVGFPTANLDSASEVMPPEGVYAVWARIMDCELIPGAGGKMRLEDRTQNRRWEAVLNYGKRPTFGEETKPVAEVHVLDFEGDLTQKTVEVTIGKHLRPEMTFANQDLLCEQIERDIEVARKFFLTQN